MIIPSRYVFLGGRGLVLEGGVELWAQTRHHALLSSEIKGSDQEKSQSHPTYSSNSISGIEESTMGPFASSSPLRYLLLLLLHLLPAAVESDNICSTDNNNFYTSGNKFLYRTSKDYKNVDVTMACASIGATPATFETGTEFHKIRQEGGEVANFST